MIASIPAELRQTMTKAIPIVLAELRQIPVQPVKVKEELWKTPADSRDLADYVVTLSASVGVYCNEHRLLCCDR